MKFYLFHDDIEELLVAAENADDAFMVVEEVWGSEAADVLVLSGLKEYPDLVTKPRGIVCKGEPGTFRK